MKKRPTGFFKELLNNELGSAYPFIVFFGIILLPITIIFLAIRWLIKLTKNKKNQIQE